MIESEVIKIAQEAAVAGGYQLSDYLEPTIDFDQDRKEWRVFFDHTPPGQPGSHFSVWVNDQTGEARIVPGR